MCVHEQAFLVAAGAHDVGSDFVWEYRSAAAVFSEYSLETIATCAQTSLAFALAAAAVLDDRWPCRCLYAEAVLVHHDQPFGFAAFVDAAAAA